MNLQQSERPSIVVVTLVLLRLLQGPVWSQELSPAKNVVRIAVTGESNLKSKFIESLKDAAGEQRLSIEVVPRSDAAL